MQPFVDPSQLCIEYKNDEKGNHNSTEARLHCTFQNPQQARCGELSLKAFGYTGVEAQELLLERLQAAILQLQDFHDRVVRLPKETAEQRDARLVKASQAWTTGQMY